MEIDIQEVALLARLELTDEERSRLGAQLQSILAHVDQLGELATDDVPATRHPVPLEIPYRDDQVGDHLQREEGLANAPETDGASFVVPRIV